LSRTIIPALNCFLREDIGLEREIAEPILLRNVEALERAQRHNHSLALQQRLEKHQSLIECGGIQSAREEAHIPDRYLALNESAITYKEVNFTCPACKNDSELSAMWDWEADMEPEGDVWPYIDVKCVICSTCSFYIDAEDIERYISTDEIVSIILETLGDETWDY